MEYKEFVVKCFSELSHEEKMKVTGYFPAIAASSLSDMKPIQGIDLPFNCACTGSDKEAYVLCLLDSIVLAKGDSLESIELCSESAKVLSALVCGGKSSFVSNPVSVMKFLGYKDFEISTEELGDSEEDEEYESDDWEDTEEEWNPSNTETVEDPVEDIPVVDDSKEETQENPNDFDKELFRCFGGTIPNYVSKVLNTYDLMYSSGYDLRRPYGVLGCDGVYYIDSKNHRNVRGSNLDMDFSTSIKMYSLFQRKLGFNEKPYRSLGVIGLEIVKQYISNSSVLMYFPMKALEVMYGRVPATASKESRGEEIVYYSMSPNINSWEKYKTLDLKPHFEKLLMQCVKYYIENTDRKDNLRSLDTVNAVNGLLSFAVACLSVGVFVIDYKSSNGLPVKFKIRVSDPLSKLGAEDYTSTIIREVFSNNIGGLESKRVASGLNKQLSEEYGVYEYAHEFNHKLSNATPLFAYKALEALQAKGENPNWDTAIIGQAMDDTILRNGSGGINMASSLFHHINAGSRSGKGVMTLNMLASGIASGKALFYLDNKVDMGSMLSSLAHSNGSCGYPEMFVVNGSNFEKDDFGEFANRNDWVIQEHIPQEVRTLFGSSSWETIGELFYLRAYMLCLGIIFARGSDSNGKANDPMFGGKEGLMIVVDEINQVQTRMLEKATAMADVVPPLDSEYQNRIDAIKLAAESEKEQAKLPKLIRGFQRQFNGSAYYALSLLKSYGDCIQSIKNKSFSGFRDSEARTSDIFIIGQNLEPVPIGDLNGVLKTCRYKNDSDVGLNKLSNGGNKVRSQSIPYQMTLFKNADAFIGYNGAQPDYLKQNSQDSNACGVLDKIARGFAYVPKFEPVKEDEKPATQFCSKEKANSPSTIYFKPYLILNKSDMDSSYVQEMFGYAYAEGAGATREQVIAEYPDEQNPNNLSRNVGFTEYMGMMGLDNLPARLGKGAEVANHVVSNYLGYKGEPGSCIPLWLQFVTDLRVEWMFSPQDVWALCTGNSEYNLGKGIKSKITGEYYQYVKDILDLQVVGVEISDPSLTPSIVYGDGSFSSKDAEDFESRAGFYSKEDGSNSAEEYQLENERLSDAMGDSSSFDEDESIFNEEDSANSDDLSSMRSDEAFNFQMHNRAGSAGYATVSEAVSSANMRAVEDAIRVLKESGYSVSLDMGSYQVGSDGKVSVDYTPAESSSDLGSIFESVNLNNYETSEDTLKEIVNGVTKRVIQDYGGLNRINSFAVVGDSLVINKVMYRCKINKDIASRLYVDLRREINAGNINRLFNYKMLAGMENLIELKCDSVSFMHDYVNYGAFGDSDVPIRAYFEAFPRLSLLQIGTTKYTRKSVQEEDMQETYYVQTKCSKFFDNVHDVSKKVNKETLHWGKSKLTDKRSRWYQKVLWTPVVIGAVGVTAATRGASAGISSAKVAIDKSRARKANNDKINGFVQNLKSGFSAAKNSVKDLFEE